MNASAHAITKSAWRLPWQDPWVPHGLIDIIRGCNITCRACYNTATPRAKPLGEIRDELDVLQRHRHLDSVSIVGGEPLLHPELLAVVRLIKSAGISVELFTNGLSLNDASLAELKAAGTNLIFLHIDAQQTRPDLPTLTPAALRQLRESKASAITAAGIEAGLAVTAYADALAEIDAAVELVLTSPDLDYLLVTLCRDTPALGQLRGDIHTGLYSPPGSAPAPLAVTLTNTSIHERLQSRFDLRPFAYIGSSIDARDPRWLSYLVGTIVRPARLPFWHAIAPSAIEPLFLKLFRCLKGRFPFYMPQSPGRFRVQLLLNALTGGRMSNFALLARSFRGRLRTKRLLFQCPAELGADGRLIHCEHCPDATVRNGRLVPVCVCDQVLDAGGSECRSRPT